MRAPTEKELVADVRAHAVRERVWMFEGKILDGRNRYLAARAAGIAAITTLGRSPSHTSTRC
jgi:hypothetical protein